MDSATAGLRRPRLSPEDSKIGLRGGPQTTVAGDHLRADAVVPGWQVAAMKLGDARCVCAVKLPFAAPKEGS